MDYVHVAAAVIKNSQGEILIAKRPEDKHQGGLWEFPGGKVEAGEEVFTALQRELHEELGLEVTHARQMIRVKHRYPDKSVLLDVWLVDEFSGEAHGREGQPLQWVSCGELGGYDFPAANKPIVTAASLPECYLITPSPDTTESFMSQLEEALNEGIKLVQLRAKGLDDEAYLSLARRVVERCHAYGAKLLLNGDPAWVDLVGADGVQLSSGRLKSLSSRPLAAVKWVAASCHNAEELQKALQLKADFALLSPVKWTKSHPDMAPIGWQAMRELIDEIPIPVYALGGVSHADLGDAWRAGGQGIAAIRSLWPGM